LALLKIQINQSKPLGLKDEGAISFRNAGKYLLTSRHVITSQKTWIFTTYSATRKQNKRWWTVCWIQSCNHLHFHEF